MLKMKEFLEIKKLKEDGFTKSEVVKVTGLKQFSVRKYWDYSIDDFADSDKLMRNDKIEKYRNFLMKELKDNPEIRNTTLFDKIKEMDAEFSASESAFYRYMRKLREVLGISGKVGRAYQLIGDTKPGELAQVDMGEIWIRDVYDVKVKIYFWCIVLMYSRYKFVYCKREAFTSKDFVDAHERAFAYFGGRPKTIMYDQDRVLVVSENCGNVIFTKEFEIYKDFIGLDVYLCKKQDPDTKGRVENVVKFVKTSFFDHKVFCGIDNLNSDLLDWLDRTGNGKVNMTTRRTPRDMFKEEKEYLLKHTPYSLRKKNEYIATATDLNYLIFRSNYYTLPAFRFKQGDKVLVEIVGDFINVYDAETKEFVARHKLLIGKGLTSKLANRGEDNKHSRLIKRTIENFGDNKLAIEFLNEIIREKPRYVKEQCGLIKKIVKEYSLQEIANGIKWCNKNSKFDATELLTYLMAHSEKDTDIMPIRTKRTYVERAEGLNKYMGLIGGGDEEV